MEPVIVTPSKVRGMGNILTPLSNYIGYQGVVVFTDEYYDNLRIMKLRAGTQSYVDSIIALNTTLIKNLEYESNGDITFETINTNDVSSVSDLNGVIYGLRFDNNGNITFNTFYSEANYLSDLDLEFLRTAVTSISYDSDTGNVTFDVIGDRL